MEGILLIDKPKGPSSFDVVKKVRSCSGIKKVGHAGTLDPLASGLMIICLGKYTKLAGYLAGDHKTYEAQIILGTSTTTDDGEGEILQNHQTSHLLKSEVIAATNKFVGPISQMPPRFSAKKINGQRAYKLARASKEFELKPRVIKISEFVITSLELPKLDVKINCSSGTYIRSIARDLGEALLVGGFAKEIRRISSGAFDIQDAIKLSELNADCIKSRLLQGPKAVKGFELVELSQEDRQNAICGRKLSAAISISSAFALATYENELLALLEKSANTVKTARVF